MARIPSAITSKPKVLVTARTVLNTTSVGFTTKFIVARILFIFLLLSCRIRQAIGIKGRDGKENQTMGDTIYFLFLHPAPHSLAVRNSPSEKESGPQKAVTITGLILVTRTVFVSLS